MAHQRGRSKGNASVWLWQVQTNCNRRRQLSQVIIDFVLRKGRANLLCVLGFDWSSVPQGGLVVDVGCGLGHVSLEIAKVRPDLHIVLEDRPEVIQEAKDVRPFLCLCSSPFSAYQLP